MCSSMCGKHHAGPSVHRIRRMLSALASIGCIPARRVSCLLVRMTAETCVCLCVCVASLGHCAHAASAAHAAHRTAEPRDKQADENERPASTSRPVGM